jgi:hypothetical protein
MKRTTNVTKRPGKSPGKQAMAALLARNDRAQAARDAGEKRARAILNAGEKPDRLVNVTSYNTSPFGSRKR